MSVPVELNFLGGLSVERKSQMQPNPRSLGALEDYSQGLELCLVINGALAEYVQLTMAFCSNTPYTKELSTLLRGKFAPFGGRKAGKGEGNGRERQEVSVLEPLSELS